MNITVGGYYGFGNLGDEETLRLLISDIKREYPRANITVLSRTPCKFAHSVSRSSPVDIRRALSDSDVFILGGGSLIQDATGVPSLFYYCELIKLAHRMGCKVMMPGCGIGPLTHRKYSAEALRLCSYISVRDESSARILREMGIPCTAGADRVLESERLTYSGKGRYFTVNLRECAGRRQPNVDAIADGLYPYINMGLMPIYISMQDSLDLEICRRAAGLTGGRVITPTCFEDLKNLQKGAKFALGMRLHFLISAALCSCPALSLTYDPKCRCLDFPSLDPFRLSPYELTEAISRLSPVRVPDGASELCRRDILEIGKLCAEVVENGRRCLK